MSPAFMLLRCEGHLHKWPPFRALRHTDLPRNRRYHLGLGRLRGKIAPAIEVVSQEIICTISGHDLGVSGIDQGKSPACRADVHRLPETVKHQDLTVQ